MSVQFNWKDQDKNSIIVTIPNQDNVTITKDDIMSFKSSGKKKYIKIIGFRYGFGGFGSNRPPTGIFHYRCTKKEDTDEWEWDDVPPIGSITTLTFIDYKSLKKEYLNDDQAFEAAAAEEARFGAMEEKMGGKKSKRRKLKRRKSKKRKSKRRRTKKR